MLSPSAQAEPGQPVEGKQATRGASAPARSDTQRIQALEQKIFQAARYIEGLHRELQVLKRAAGVATPPVGTKGPRQQGRRQAPSGAAPTPSAPPGTQHAFRGPSPERLSPSEVERRKAAERLEEEERVSQEQETPELQGAFLRAANAVLIPKGRLEITPALLFRHTNQNAMRVRGVDLIETIFVGTIEVGRLKRSVVNHSYSMRYGLTDRIQLNLAVPYQRSFRQEFLDPEIQRRVGEPTETRTSGGGLGDISGGLSIHLLREGDYLPDLILTASYKSDTGTSPFDVDSETLATGTGFSGLRTGFTIVKVTDPAVLFLSGGYFYHHASDAVKGFKEVDPPDRIDVGFGLSYALNPFLSLSTSFSGGYAEKTSVTELFSGREREIDGSDQVTASLGLGATYALSSKTSLDISAAFGLTDDSPDFAVQVSTPISFVVPSFWEDWKSWKLSRLFRF
jgi:hypothetical protein